ncbi:hypothetical protein [Francisella sp. 19X1-34]|uniref:hypothetical protein n=1 Tax=Francisella sp. 19X1-34 TaxID=3087177 RepID=UPI002E319C6B|nr:hypothetical protein [Francisella sp. 19X1-34]MED7789138.1 hypothetical protein [Francisella sp. 19X1-34]
MKKYNTKSILEIASMLSLEKTEVTNRLRIIGGYREELTKSSSKARLDKEDIEYIISFEVFEQTDRQGGNVLVEKIKKHPDKYRIFTHSLFDKKLAE